jgi:hypothetical protein
MPDTDPHPHVLQDYGLTQPINIVGQIERLLPGQGVPIVFLIDENHGSDECIKQNIANATELVLKTGVTLIGVESHRGGLEWSDYDEGKYTTGFDMGENQEPVNTRPQFADNMRASRAKVLGVECLGMSNQQEPDFYEGGSWHGKPMKDHPLDRQRSEHFVRTLFELRRRHKLDGNLILNAGGDHISHIAGFIKDGIIETLAQQKAAYVRARAPAYGNE